MSDCEDLGNCPDARVEKLYEYLDGALSHQDIEDIKVHMDNCTVCTEEYDLERLIRSVVKRSCAEAAPENLKAGILSRINEIKTGGQTSSAST
ncbi:mycothiol system anti-sigma-R factor [Arthrobacter castelli]|uniref:mycothiol system anti-sigma-R factor n=1 Tax=Arthrobacter castelli TaxID=271431 RepID=UPI00040A0BCD|nr:mycothiol system anti-sigma-R factor [Arthrobacter castelli]